MSEHKSPIPSMIYNAAVGGHVTNSQQIIDENLNREQNDINQEIVGTVPYNSTTPNGMGRVVLKKNDNFKEVVEAQTNGNTVFIIKYNFILTGDVTVPANCILKFDGGSIIGNGTEKNIIIGNNTSIIAPIKHVFFDVVFEGTVTEDFVLNNFKNSNNCTDSAYNTHRAIRIVGTCVIDAPLVVKDYFSIYGDSSDGSKIELDTNYNGEIKTIFLFDSADGGIGYTSFRNFKVTDIDYVFYRNCNSRAVSTGSIFLTTYENLYFENISKSLFYVKCYGFSTAKINNIFVGGQCNNEGEALMWFDVYYFNYNIISGSNFSGLVVKKLMYVYTANNQDEFGELNLNSILNDRFENIYLRNSNTEDCLIHFSSKNTLYSTNIEGNYIERIYKSDSTLATIFRFSIAQNKILRQINVTNNFFNGEFENLIYFDANVVIVNLIGNAPLITQNITCGKEFLYDIAKINNSCRFNIVAPNASVYTLIEEDNISKINNFDGKLRNVVYSKIIPANSYIDIKLIPDEYNKPIYYSDIQITYGNRRIITGKVASMDGINFEFIKTFGDTDVLTATIIDLNGNLRLNNISDNALDIKVGIFIANYE